MILGKRGILERIILKDEHPSVRMVLCVGEIRVHQSCIQLELTDGWSSIRADITA